MPEDKITPEEKLLKIIEGPKAGGVPGGKFPLGVPKSTGGFKLDSIFSRIKGLLRFDKEKLKRFDLNACIKILAGLSVLLTVFLFFDFFRGSMSFSKRLKDITSGAYGPGIERKKKLIIEVNLAQALGANKKRNMFSFIPPKAVIEFDSARVEIQQLVSNLKLVGILWSDSPQAMIEDNREKKTYLVGAGERIGELTVKKILKDRVIIGKGEQEWDLR